MGTEVNEVINNICDKLGILASELIPEMGKMKVAEYGSMCAIAVIILLVAVVMLIMGVKKSKEDQRDEAGGTLIIVGILLIVVTVIPLIFIIPDFVGWIASPKAKTFEYVLSKLGVY